MKLPNILATIIHSYPLSLIYYRQLLKGIIYEKYEKKIILGLIFKDKVASTNRSSI